MTTKIKYIYLDDEPPHNVRGFAASVESESLSVEHEHPKPYFEQIKELKVWQSEGNLDGLILDLRLDNFYNTADPDSEKANYRAATLAQEIRTRATEGEINDYPIILWSTDERLNESYDRDYTGHDLFDLKTVKRELVEESNALIVSGKLQSLVKGYAIIKETIGARNPLYSLLGFTDHPDFLDERVLLALDSPKGFLPVHEYARFIVRQLLEIPGPLINEYVLAARLGIDISSSEDFNNLVNTFFRDAAYQGAFSDGWPCWWAALVDRIWREAEGSPNPLRSIQASERVAFLRNWTGFQNLQAATPSVGEKDTTFWTICTATLRPIDPRNGFLIEKQPIYSWQERQYVSLEALLEGYAAQKRIRLDFLEIDRFEKAKKRLKTGESE